LGRKVKYCGSIVTDIHLSTCLNLRNQPKPAEKLRLRQELCFVVNDLSIIYKFMVAFQAPSYSLFSTWHAIVDTSKALKKLGQTKEENFSPETKALLAKSSPSAKKDVVAIFRECAKAGYHTVGPHLKWS